MTQAKPPTTLNELVSVVELTRVAPYRLSAERQVTGIDSMAEATCDVQGRTRFTSTEIEGRFDMTVRTPDAQYLADFGATYTLTSPIGGDIPNELIAQFLGDVAVMAVYPYLRQAIAGLAADLYAQIPTIGLLQRGEIRFEPVKH